MTHTEFEWLVRASWQASVLAAIVMATQWIAGHRLTARWRCYLWLVVACRFLLPCSFQSPVSVFNLAAREPAALKQTPPARPAGRVSVQPKSPAERHGNAAASEGDGMIGAEMKEAEASPSRLSAWLEMARRHLPLIWLFGAGALALWTAASSALLAWRLRAATPITDEGLVRLLGQCAAEMKVRRAVVLVESGAITSPALQGMWRPRLILPPGMSQSLSPEQIRFVFLHEMAHVRRWDIATGWLMTGIQVLHWFNPVAWFAARHVRIERELACDALVLGRAGSDQRKPYGETILRLAEHIGKPALAPGIAGVLQDTRGLRRRIKLIADFKPSSSLAGWSALGLAVLAAAGLTDPVVMRGGNAGSVTAEQGWEKLASADLLKGRGGSSVVWTGSEMVVFGGEGMGTSYDDGAQFDAAENVWRPLPSEGAPASRTQHTAVWTGQEMLIWGGFGGVWGNNSNRNDGARFDPRSNAWRPISTNGAPGARFQHTAVWSGQEMLIWGGYTDAVSLYHGAYAKAYLNNGGAYNPASDSWREISSAGAPSERYNHVALWTGNRMIIWGGNDSTQALNDGALYDPASDSWTPMSAVGAPCPRKQPAAVWTGKEMIVWGGDSRDDRTYYQDGARYNPATDTWTPISTNGAPIGRVCANAVWTGSKMVFWGGVNDAQAGMGFAPQVPPGAGAIQYRLEAAKATFDPRGTLQLQGAKLGEENPAAGSVTIQAAGPVNITFNKPGTLSTEPNPVVPGQATQPVPVPSRYVNTGAAYDPATDTWTLLSTNNAPSARLTSIVWIGSGILSFGGYNGTHLNDAYFLPVSVDH